MDVETSKSIFQYLRDEQKPVYVAAITGLANARKLRPVFVQKKPVADQIAWLSKSIKMRGAGEVAENVLQLWLLKANPEMLTHFLDAVGIAHDGEGTAEELPDDFDPKTLAKTVDEMVEKFGAEKVKIYLNTFQMQRNGGWQEIADLIAERPDLQYTQ